MDSDKIFEVIHKIDNDCKPKGYFVFSIAKNYFFFCLFPRENVMCLLHRDIYSQSNVYAIL